VIPAFSIDPDWKMKIAVLLWKEDGFTVHSELHPDLPLTLSHFSNPGVDKIINGSEPLNTIFTYF
jgi:hypothetical protein